MQRRVSLIRLTMMNVLLLEGCAATHVQQKNHAPGPTITIRQENPNEAFNYIWGILREMSFYHQHGYTVVLPQHSLFQQAAQGKISLTPLEKNRLYTLFVEQLYKQQDYAAGLNALKPIHSFMSSILENFLALNQQWSFKIFGHYDIVLTLYGPGGSYNPQAGKVIMLTTPAGQFKRKESPYHTIVHEMVHLGVEDVIVQKYELSHDEKEHLVDLICAIKFKQQMPNYRMQPITNTGLTDFVNPQTLTNLPRAIEAFVAEHPRPRTVE